MATPPTAGVWELEPAAAADTWELEPEPDLQRPAPLRSPILGPPITPDLMRVARSALPAVAPEISPVAEVLREPERQIPPLPAVGPSIPPSAQHRIQYTYGTEDILKRPSLWEQARGALGLEPVQAPQSLGSATTQALMNLLLMMPRGAITAGRESFEPKESGAGPSMERLSEAASEVASLGVRPSPGARLEYGTAVRRPNPLERAAAGEDLRLPHVDPRLLESLLTAFRDPAFTDAELARLSQRPQSGVARAATQVLEERRSGMVAPPPPAPPVEAVAPAAPPPRAPRPAPARPAPAVDETAIRQAVTDEVGQAMDRVLRGRPQARPEPVVPPPAPAPAWTLEPEVPTAALPSPPEPIAAPPAVVEPPSVPAAPRVSRPAPLREPTPTEALAPAEPVLEPEVIVRKPEDLLVEHLGGEDPAALVKEATTEQLLEVIKSGEESDALGITMQGPLADWLTSYQEAARAELERRTLDVEPAPERPALPLAPEGQIIPPSGEPSAAALAPPPGPRWTADRGSIPGEPAYYLDRTSESEGQVAIVEQERADGTSVWEAVDANGNLIGTYSTPNEAAIAAEKRFPLQPEPQMLAPAEAAIELTAALPPVEPQRPGPKLAPKPPPTQVPAPTRPAPARPGPAGAPTAYEAAGRLDQLMRRFADDLAAGTLPKNAGDLRRLAGELLGMDPKVIGQDAAVLDDVFDALEGAVNRVYRQQPRSDDLPTQIEAARQIENVLGHRTRTLELSARQQFSTPLPIAEAAAYALDLKPGETVVEPTAGTGNLLAPLPNAAIQANEIDPRRAAILQLLGYQVTGADALRAPLPGDVAIMNPPWGKYSTTKYGKPIPLPYGEGVDVAERFVVKQLRDLPDGGRIAAVMPTTILKSPAFLRWLETTHTLRALIQAPPGAYTTRGTDVESVLLVVDKGRDPDAPSALRGAAGTWPEFAALVAPLARGGTHARVGRAGQPSPISRPVAGVVGAPERVPRPAPARPADVGGGGPGERGVEAGVPAVERPAPAGGGREPAPDVVAGVPPGGVEPAPQPPGPGRVVPAEPGEPGAGAKRVIEPRYSVADPAEFEAASRSVVFTPAPLRSAAGSNPHPRLVVKTRSLAGAPIPDLTYTPQGRLLPDAYRRKVISDAQWDYGIVPALQANAKGHGFLVAADVGVGKTRIAAGIIGEWLETGVDRVLYVTNNEVNLQDVKREFDLYAGGKFPFSLLEIKTFPDAKEKPSAPPQPLPVEHGVYLIDRYNLAKYATAIRQLGFDAILGDEAHLYGNIESQTGKAWMAIQAEALQRGGKFVYMTATPAVDFDDLQHFIGLREWAPDGFQDYKLRVTGQEPTPREDPLPQLIEEASALHERLRQAFLQDDEGEAGFTAWARDHLAIVPPHPTPRDRPALEHNLAELKSALVQRGQQTTVGGDAEAAGVTAGGGGRRRRFGQGGDPFSSFITPAEQEQVMRELAMKGKYDSVDLWRAGVEFSITTVPPSQIQRSEYADLAAFMKDLNEAFLRFGRMTDMKQGRLTIRQHLQMEAKRRLFDYRLDDAIRLAKEAVARGEQPVLSSVFINPGDEHSGPIPAAINTINARHVETDPQTGEITVDEDIPEALQVRADLLERWSEFRQARDPIAELQQAFGKDQVAVISGKATPKMREKLIRDFQEGKRKVAWISAAGKTGISLHHILETPGGAQGRRHLIVTDYEWSATTFKQELGRVDRSGQVSAPKVTPLSTGTGGERKFLATIANRMRNLGALSKGSAESASNDKLAEFELGGSLDTHAMRLAYRELPRDIQDAFLGGEFKAHGTPIRGYPQGASLKTFLLDLQFMPMEMADQAFELFWAKRAEVIAQREADAQTREAMGASRTRTLRGTLVRSTPLRSDLTLHEVHDAAGQKYAILQGLITPYMPKLRPFLPGSSMGDPHRYYLTFSAGEEQLSGLLIPQGQIGSLARAFGSTLGGELKTLEQVLQALRAGDKIPLQGEAAYRLRMRPSDKLIVIEGAKMAQKDSLQRHGARYVPAGNLWTIPEEKLGGFLERFPVKSRDAPVTEAESPEDVSRAQLREVRTQQEVEGQAGRLPVPRFLQGAPPSPRAAPLRSQEPSVEAAVTSTAPGPLSVRQRLREAYQQFRRTFSFEYDLRDFPTERDEVRVFQSARRQAFARAGEDIIGIVGRLPNRQELDHFTRLVILRDYRARLSDRVRFPGGVPEALSLEQVEAELGRLAPTASERVQAALAAHDRLMAAERADLEARGLLDPERAIAHYFPHQVLDYARERGGIGTGRRIREPFRGYTHRARGSARSIETDYIRVMFEHRARVRHDNAVDDFALEVLRRHDRRGDVPADVRRALKPGQRVELDDEVYQAIQYRPGRSIFRAYTVPETALADAIAQGSATLEIPVETLAPRGALGRYFRLYVVPEAIAQRFEHFAPEQAQGLVKALNDATRRWKAITIGFWGQAGNVMNLMGDLMNLARQDPVALAHLPAAVRDVLQWKYGTGSDLVRRMEEYDVLSSGYVANETHFRARAPELRQFLTQAEQLRAAARRAVDVYFRDIPELREALPRAAMARTQLARVERAAPLRGRGLDIAGLEPERAAMKIAREFTVDYGKFTPDEDRYLRGLLLPFYAWAKHNTGNWLRYLVAAPLGALSFLGTRLLLELWNNQDDESRKVEQSLPPYKRNQAHVVTGWRDEAGKLIVVYWAGDPLADALSLIGLAGAPARLSDAFTGRLTLDQAARRQLEAFLSEPGQRGVNLLTPFLKVPVEIATGRSALTGQELVPRGLEGTREALGRRVTYGAESFFRPLREARRFREQAGTQGFDWLTHRFGAGLPFERVDLAEAGDRVKMAKWFEGRAEYVEQALGRLRDTDGFLRAKPHQQEVLLRTEADRAGREYTRRVPFPVSKGVRFERAMGR